MDTQLLAQLQSAISGLGVNVHKVTSAIAKKDDPVNNTNVPEIHEIDAVRARLLQCKDEIGRITRQLPDVNAQDGFTWKGTHVPPRGGGSGGGAKTAAAAAAVDDNDGIECLGDNGGPQKRKASGDGDDGSAARRRRVESGGGEADAGSGAGSVAEPVKDENANIAK